ncbi:hypothetical protein [Bradyrhizobium shewense]|uniref:hypothetical protein n=1 Tax=Bradyrhizobium shewense TaxID=1761772 RepID=UPI0013F6333F|nr:hypothetical protein [Bradyrhizobium shewense]
MELVEIGASLLQQLVVSGIQALVVWRALSERNSAHAEEGTRKQQQFANFHDWISLIGQVDLASFSLAEASIEFRS